MRSHSRPDLTSEYKCHIFRGIEQGKYFLKKWPINTADITFEYLLYNPPDKRIEKPPGWKGCSEREVPIRE